MHGNEEIPSVPGVGLPMPFNKLTPFVDRATGERVVSMPLDYWKNMGRNLLGGESEIVLPWSGAFVVNGQDYGDTGPWLSISVGRRHADDLTTLMAPDSAANG